MTQRRTYQSQLRQDNAAATRERILLAAQACFEASGYAATTLRAIAQEAKLSIESVNLNGPKRRLLIAALNRATTDEDTADPALDLKEPRQLFNHPDPRLALSGLMEWIATSNARISRIWRAVDQAADTDPEIAEEHGQLIGRMRAECRRAIDELAARTPLRADHSPAELADLLWLLVLPDQHRRLCGQAGWTQERYRDWLKQTALETLLPA